MHVAPSAFDSEIYDIAIGRLVGDDGDLAAALTEARARGIAVVFARAVEHGALDRRLVAGGHEPLERLVTSRFDPREPAAVSGALDPAIVISEYPHIADAATADQIAVLTAAAISRSHLHADPRLPADRTRALYAAWGRNDATGRAQRTFLAADVAAPSQVIGFLTAVMTDDATAMIDLVAVAESARNRGIGNALIQRFLAWTSEAGFAATVGTQATNPALGLYVRLGFVPTTTHVNYHLWLA